MSSFNHDSQTQNIPLNKLKKSPRNVRKTPHTKAHIEALADSVSAHGQIQNLVVETERDEAGQATGFFLVTAGEGRRLAHLLRVKRKQINDDELIRCIVDDEHDAHTLSLAENDLRASMHPADQFIAFKQLVDGGQSVEEVAAQFGVAPMVVTRRLKLANVAPEFLILYRKQAISLDHLMAFAITDDHGKQRQVWENLPKHGRSPEALRRALTENEIAIHEDIVKFVGLKNYEKAGGLIRRDLFAEAPDDGFVLDPDLLQKLATQKLERRAAKLKREGCAWVQIVPQIDYSTLAEFRRVRSTSRPPTEDEQATLNRLYQERQNIEQEIEAAGEDDERLEELSNTADDVAEKISVLEESLQVPDARQVALTGAVIAIGRGGELRTETGLLLPDDAKRFESEDKAAEKSEAKMPRLHSATLTRRLTAHRTLALRATVAQRPDVALIALTHRLAMQTFYGDGYSARNVVQIDAEPTDLDEYGSDVPKCKAHHVLSEQGEALRSLLPQNYSMLFGWLVQQPQQDVMRLCAYCVAMTLNGVSGDEESRALDALATAAGLDMREWWTPTAESYLGSLPKSRILDVLTEAGAAESTAVLRNLKKSELAHAAERHLAGRGWLPGLLRAQAG
ncbi:MAG: ParB N-terminal domain-containing protein [Steroidobacter sp.]